MIGIIEELPSLKNNGSFVEMEPLLPLHKSTHLNGSDPNTLEYFQYEPLKDEETQIRLVKFNTRAESGYIECSLVTTDLEESNGSPPQEQNRYYALSYAWGNPAPFATIICNGKRLRVAENLYRALTRLKTVNDYLWVDAICINQSDDREKSLHVGFMADIYEKAHTTFVWLGELSTSDRADPFKPLDEFIEMLVNYQKLGQGSIDLDTIDWPGLSDILINPWFCRKWIVQEVLFSRRVRVIWGEKSIDWSEFGERSAWLRDHLPDERLRNMVLLRLTEEVGTQQADQTNVSFLNLVRLADLTTRDLSELCCSGRIIHDMSLFKTSDIRDAFFTLLAIYGKVLKLSYAPDYSLKASDVFYNSIAVLSETDQHSETLSGKWYHPKIPHFGRDVIVPMARRSRKNLKNPWVWLSLYSQCSMQALAGRKNDLGSTLVHIYTSLASLLGIFYRFPSEQSGQWATALLGLFSRWCTEHDFQPRKLRVRRHTFSEGEFSEAILPLRRSYLGADAAADARIPRRKSV